MTFSVDSLYNLEEDVSSVLNTVIEAAKCNKVKDLDKAHLNRCNKDALVNLVLDLVKTLESSSVVLRGASAKIDDLKTDQIENQKCVMRLQDEVIKSKEEQVEEVQTVFKTEFKSSVIMQ